MVERTVVTGPVGLGSHRAIQPQLETGIIEMPGSSGVAIGDTLSTPSGDYVIVAIDGPGKYRVARR